MILSEWYVHWLWLGNVSICGNPMHWLHIGVGLREAVHLIFWIVGYLAHSTMQHPCVAQISDQSEVQLYPHILRESQVWGEIEQIRGIWGIFTCKAFFFFLWNIFPFGLCELCAAHQSYPTLHDPSRPVSRNAQFDVCVKIDLYDNDTIFPPFIVQGFYRYFSGKAHSAWVNVILG